MPHRSRRGPKGITAFIVERIGVSGREKLDKLACGSPTSELVFEDCECRKKMSSARSAAVRVLMSGLDYERRFLP